MEDQASYQRNCTEMYKKVLANHVNEMKANAENTSVFSYIEVNK